MIRCGFCFTWNERGVPACIRCGSLTGSTYSKIFEFKEMIQ